MSLPVLRATLMEAVGRKVLLWALIAAAGFATLFGIGFYLIYREVQADQFSDAMDAALFGGMFTVLALYVASFLGSFLAMTLASSSVSAEIDSGVTQAVVVRPMTRRSWYLQRWAGLSLLAAAYTVVLGGGLLLCARLVAKYEPTSTLGLLGLMACQGVFLVTIGMLASTRLSTMATGVAMFSYFGLSWLGGFVGFIGTLAQRDSLENTATVVSLLAPSDGIWKAASYFAVPSGINLSAFAEQAQMPFANFNPPSGAYVVWVLVFTLLALLGGALSFARRDL